MSGGRVSFVFFPSPEPDIIYVNFNFSPGTSKENTSSMITEFEIDSNFAKFKSGLTSSI